MPTHSNDLKYLLTYLAGCTLLMAYLLHLTACANPVSPQGGPRDTIPPLLDTARSTQPQLTNFEGREITLTFKEWVTLTDAFNQVVVSPPLEYRPDIKLRGKRVVVELDDREVLRPNTTYLINFGKAVKDLTEGNVPLNLQYVFSTGPTIDSLTATGRVIDVESKPVEGVLVMLYDNLADSLPRTERPYYFARTDKEGRFRMDFLKSGTYQVFALRDENFNYRYDLDNEQIGFLDSAIVIADTIRPDVTITFFEPQPQVLLLDKRVRDYGVAAFTFNIPASFIEVEYDNPFGSPIVRENADDTLKLYYADRQEQVADWQVRFSTSDSSYRDTVGFVIPNADPFYQVNVAVVPSPRPSEKATTLLPGKSARIPFLQPLGSYDSLQIVLLADTTRTRVAPRGISIDKRELLIDYRWREGTPYRLQLLPGAVTDLYGIDNDSLTYDYKIAKAADFGNLLLTLTLPDSTAQYVVQLNGPSGPVREDIVSNTSTKLLTYRTLPPGTYSLEVIYDRNANGRWDSGDFDTRAQPERRTTLPLSQPVRANWDVEAAVEVPK